MGFVVFGLITLGVPLLLAALPSVLLVFARGMRPSSRALWVLLSLLPIVALVVVRDQALPMALFLFPPWAVYLLYLWFGSASSKTARPGSRRIGLALTTAAFSVLTVMIARSVYQAHVEETTYHTIVWPLDESIDHQIELRVPPGFRFDSEYFSGSSALKKGSDHEYISTWLDWPSMKALPLADVPEAVDVGSHLLEVEFDVFNRYSYRGHPVDAVQCSFELASHDFPSGCAKPTYHDFEIPLALVSPRHGLQHRAWTVPMKLNLVNDDAWFVPRSDGWSVQGSQAVSPLVPSASDLPAVGFDEWYVYEGDVPREHHKAFVNRLGFSPLDPACIEADEFWEQVERFQPLHVLGAGTPTMFLVTRDKQTYARAVDFESLR